MTLACSSSSKESAGLEFEPSIRTRPTFTVQIHPEDGCRKQPELPDGNQHLGQHLSAFLLPRFAVDPVLPDVFSTNNSLNRLLDSRNTRLAGGIIHWLSGRVDGSSSLPAVRYQMEFLGGQCWIPMFYSWRWYNGQAHAQLRELGYMTANDVDSSMFAL